MASNTHLSVASWDLALDAALNVLNNGTIHIYTGTQPATPDAPLSGNTLLVTLPLSSVAFTASSGGTKVAQGITTATAVATGTATFFRAFESDGITAVIDGSVGTSGADMNLNDTSISVSGNVSITSWTVSMPVGQ